MPSFASRYFHKGVNLQKKADILIDLRRPDSKKIKNWTVEQKLLATAWLNDIKSKFADFENELLKTLK